MNKLFPHEFPKLFPPNGRAGNDLGLLFTWAGKLGFDNFLPLIYMMSVFLFLICDTVLYQYMFLNLTLKLPVKKLFASFALIFKKCQCKLVHLKLS